MIPCRSTPIPEILTSLREHRAWCWSRRRGGQDDARPAGDPDGGACSGRHPALVLLQPRRVAARASAARIAEENGWTLGRGGRLPDPLRAGSARGRGSGSSTEGILNRRLVGDPFLEGVGAVVLDEFHERSLHTDLALALLREVRETVRDDLILVVMSATLDAEPVAPFLGDCPMLRVEGRAVPGRGRVSADGPSGRSPGDRRRGERRSWPARDDPGDLLVFLPGAEEIRRAAARLEPLAGREEPARASRCTGRSPPRTRTVPCAPPIVASSSWRRTSPRPR